MENIEKLAKESLYFNDLVQINPRIQGYGDCDGDVIADEFNRTCDMGTEIDYLEDSEWKFKDIKEAELVLQERWERDKERMGLL